MDDTLSSWPEVPVPRTRRSGFGLASPITAVVIAALLSMGGLGCAYAPPRMAHASSVAPEVVTRSPHVPHVDLTGVTIFFSDPDLVSCAGSVAFLTRLRDLLAQSGARLIDERDAASVPRAGGDLVVRLERGEIIEGTGDELLQENPIVARIYDAEGAPTATDQDGAWIDTDARSPLLVVDYDIVVAYAHMLEGGSGVTYVRNRMALEREDGERKAELLAAQLFPDLSRAEALVAVRSPLPRAAG